MTREQKAAAQRRYQQKYRTRHGERYVQLRIAFSSGQMIPEKAGRMFQKLPVKMPREEALAYYGEKLSKVWKKIIHDLP